MTGKGVQRIDERSIRSPKRRVLAKTSRANWFRYYAGFSEGFVEDIISELDLRDGATVLDPWLGSGTTSEVATAKGYRVKGYDLNPAMLVVAKARTLATNTSKQIPALTAAISRHYERSLKTDEKSLSPVSEPLEQWLQPVAARAFRRLERSVAAIVSQSKRSLTAPIWSRPDRLPAIFAFFYVGLFRTLRHFISGFQSSNPTWMKISDGKGRVYLSPDRILNRLCKEIERLSTAIECETKVMPLVGIRRCVIGQASSLNLPLSSESVDAVISSPPYCTRIDYVRATLPELAVIGYPNGEAIRRLREQMIGTPTIDKAKNYEIGDWGSTCSRFLSVVQRHPSKASSTYYLQYYLQYFASALGSLREIDRVLTKSGRCVLVVQDSYYKGIRNDLPCIFIEMANRLGWSLKHRVDFRVKQTLAAVNPGVRPYRRTFHATESALVFSK